MITTTSDNAAVAAIGELQLADPPAPASEPVVAGFLSLSLKMALAQLAPLVMSLYLAQLVARSGDLEFSSYSLVLSVNLTVSIAASAFLQSLYYVGGRAVGRGQDGEYAAAMVAGFAISGAVALLCTLVSVLVGPFLDLVQVDPPMAHRAMWLGFAAALGIPPTLIMTVYRVHASLRHYAGLVTILLSSGAVLAAVLATFEVPPGQPAGLAVLISLAIVNWLTLLAGVASLGIVKRLRLGWRTIEAARPHLADAMRTIWAVGWPIGLIVFMDSLASLASSLIAARYWPATMPVHAVAFLWLSLGLVVPLGIAQAGLQQVSVTHHAGEVGQRNRIVITALIASAAYGAVATLAFVAFPHELGTLLLHRSVLSGQTEALLAEILPLAGLALLGQSVIITAALLLRGIGFARAALVPAFIGYCVIAIGSEALFGIVLCDRLAGVWYGLILGFGGTALALSWRCVTTFGLLAGLRMPRRLASR
jgi:MATE family multidrug resistance protein